MVTWEDEQVRIDLGQLFADLWRRKFRLLAVGVLAGFLGFGLSFLIPSRYETGVTVFAQTGPRALQARVLLELEETRGRIADRAGIPLEPAQLIVELQGDTGFLEVRVITRDPETGVRLADALAQVLPQRGREVLGAELTADPPVPAGTPSIPDRRLWSLAAALAGGFACAVLTGLQSVFRPQNPGRYSRK